MTDIWQPWELYLVFGDPVPRPGTPAYRYPALTAYEAGPTKPGGYLQRAAAIEAMARDLIAEDEFEQALDCLIEAKDIMLEGWDDAYDRATVRPEGPRLRLVGGSTSKPRAIPPEPEGRSA